MSTLWPGARTVRNSRPLRTTTGSALALMGCKPRHNTIDVPTLFWAGIPGRRGRFPCRGVVLHLYRTGSLFLHRRDQLPGFALSFQESRWPTASAANLFHLDISDLPRKKWHYGQPEQIRIGWFGLREIVLHEPYAAPVLGSREPISSWSIRGTPIRDSARLIREVTGSQDGIYQNLHRGEPHIVQSLLYRGLPV